MKSRWTVFAVLALVLAWGAASLARTSSEQSEARRLHRALSEYGYFYDSLRSAEARVARAAMTETALPEQTELELREIEQQLLVLSDRLGSIAVGGELRGEILLPIIRSLRDDRADLASARELVRLEGLAEKVRERLEKHVHPPDLIHPAVSAIQERFGLRPRLWRGRPLTA